MKLYFPYRSIKYISQNFGQNANGSYQENGFTGHTGMDIVGQHRENIYASCDGYIYSTMNKDNPDLMKYRAVFQLIEEDGIAYELSYGHLMDIYVEPKTFVKKGTLIGTQGVTGNVFTGGKEVTAKMKENNSPAGSHLHFQLRLLKKNDKLDKKTVKLVDENGLLKIDGYYFEIPEYKNGYNGCCDVRPFLVMESAVSTLQGVIEVLDPKLTQTMRYGARGEQVKLLQKKLGIKSDGIFGRMTEKALKEYQFAHNLTVDAICGTKTRTELNK
jgi:murein DD-endopeptidase MepM/ murein hydrolase activator NlpD